jgi:hypothetical protein
MLSNMQTAQVIHHLQAEMFDDEVDDINRFEQVACLPWWYA